MARYIDADKLKNELSASCMPIDDREISGLFDCDESVRDVINAMPAADVRPERHGEWIEKRGYNIPLDVYEVSYNCSCCGNMVYKKYIFCSNCGAMMDGEEESG